jgi:hypothetical protein
MGSRRVAASPVPRADAKECIAARPTAELAAQTYEVAAKAYEMGQFANARLFFAAARAQAVAAQLKCNDPVLFLVRGLCAEGLFQFEDAMVLFDQAFLDPALDKTTNWVVLAKDAQRVIAEELPQVTIHLTGARLEQVRVTVDELPVSRGKADAWLVPNGKHTMVVAYLGNAKVFALDLAARERRSVEVDFSVLPAVSPAPSPVALNPVVLSPPDALVTPPPDAVVTPPPDPVVTPPVEYSQYAPAVVGAVFTTGGLVTLLSGVLVDDNPTKTKRQALVAIGTVTTLIGVATLGVGLGVVLSKPPTNRTTTLPMRIVGSVGVGSIHLSGEF